MSLFLAFPLVILFLLSLFGSGWCSTDTETTTTTTDLFTSAYRLKSKMLSNLEYIAHEREKLAMISVPVALPSFEDSCPLSVLPSAMLVHILLACDSHSFLAFLNSCKKIQLILNKEVHLGSVFAICTFSTTLRQRNVDLLNYDSLPYSGLILHNSVFALKLLLSLLDDIRSPVLSAQLLAHACNAQNEAAARMIFEHDSASISEHLSNRLSKSGGKFFMDHFLAPDIQEAALYSILPLKLNSWEVELYARWIKLVHASNPISKFKSFLSDESDVLMLAEDAKCLSISARGKLVNAALLLGNRTVVKLLFSSGSLEPAIILNILKFMPETSLDVLATIRLQRIFGPVQAVDYDLLEHLCEQENFSMLEYLINNKVFNLFDVLSCLIVLGKPWMWSKVQKLAESFPLRYCFDVETNLNDCMLSSSYLVHFTQLLLIQKKFEKFYPNILKLFSRMVVGRKIYHIISLIPTLAAFEEVAKNLFSDVFELKQLTSSSSLKSSFKQNYCKNIQPRRILLEHGLIGVHYFIESLLVF